MGAGRPSKYESDIKDKLFLIEQWARSGLTDEQMADNLGIARSTFCEYKLKYKEFADTLKKGKEVVDFEVENALYKRALGYNYLEKVYENGVLTKEIEKHMPPDTTAQIFWLKNRKQSVWRDRQEIANTFPQGDFEIKIKSNGEDNT